jgi:hypothetical protein
MGEREQVERDELEQAASAGGRKRGREEGREEERKKELLEN